jgi:hypothetical protein
LARLWERSLVFKMYGQDGLCLIWAVNNAFKSKILNPKVVFAQIAEIDRRDKKRSWSYFVNKDGIDFNTFKKVMKEKYGIQLIKVKNYSNKGKYLLTYDFGDYYHTVAMTDGEVIDSRKSKEIKDTNPGVPLVDVYKIRKSVLS